MKKLVLVFAMMLGSVGVFAQTNNISAKMINKNDLLTVKAQSEMMSNRGHQKPILKSYADNTNALCDFSETSAYVLGTTDRHSSLKEFELLTPSLELTTWWTLRGLRTSSGTTAADFATWVNNFEPNEGALIPMDINNGFVGIDMYTVEQTATIDAFIKPTTAILTNGSSIDIHFVQVLASLGNNDQYFLDWSTDQNFAAGSYDSVAFNIKGVDGNTYDLWASTALYGRKVVNIPVGTSICNVGTNGQQIYIRLRVYNPAGAYNMCLQWFVDNISYAYAPTNRIESLSYAINDGYRKIPSILEPEAFRSSAIVQNTGTATATNLKLVDRFYSLSQEGEDVNFTFISEASSTTPITLANQIMTDTNGNAYRYVEVGVDTSAISQPGNVAGAYAYTADVLYTINGEESSVNLDTAYYYVAGEDASRSNHYTWQKDIGIFIEDYSGAWDGFWEEQGLYSSGTAASSNGYRVCIAYTKYSNKINTPVYAAGVEVVPAIDSCEAGASIKASLWQWNNEATTYDNAVIEATDNNDMPIESYEHNVTAAELNNSSDPDEIERFEEGDYNTIFMPFTYQGLELQDSTTYYACYTKVGSNGKFYVAKDYDRWNSFSYDNGWSILIWSPTSGMSSVQYDWGYLWWTQRLSKGSVPAIRFIVSDVINDAPNPPSAIEDVKAEATSDMQVYPNPATDKVTLSYTLTQSGDVNITIMDVMGRVVMSENQGKKEAGFAYKTNINTSNMNNGTYFYTVEVNGAKSTNKLVINR